MKCVSIAAGLLVCSTIVSCASPPPEDDVIAEAARRVAADGGPKSYTCRRVREPITVDGRLTDAEWSHAPWTDDFVDIEGSVRPQPRFRTRAKMLWDDEYLYVSAWLEEPHVWGTLTEYDQIVFYDNDFEIFIDPNGDTEEYYEIEINALGTIFDLFLFKTYRNGGPAMHDWDAKGMKTGIHIDGTLNNPNDVDQAWSIEFAIPWQTLRVAARTDCPPKPGDAWRINFSRVQWQHLVEDGRYQKIPDTREDNWVWSPQGEINMHAPQHWGFVEFE